MSVYLYDESLLNKIKSWTDITQMKIYGPDDARQLYQVIADENNDKRLELPFLVLTRPGGYTITNTNRRPLSYNGFNFLQGEHCATKINAIPIEIRYQLDVYTRYMKESDAYTRELIFNIINHPELKVKIPYKDTQYEHIANIWVSDEVADNSDIPEIIIRGNYYRMTLNIRIDDAYLWDVKNYRNVKIEEHVDAK